ncbi:hypothetical protein HYX58_01775 [Candidatus Dependentiae bacterium]|nr:hypothetical protein [Candidatus Dependentiae bacterium]
MKKLLLILLFWFLDNNLIVCSPHEELSAATRTLLGVGLICSGYGCQKIMNYIIKRDTKQLQDRIINEEAHPWNARPIGSLNQKHQGEITYLRYASKVVSGSLASAGCYFLYGAYNAHQSS